MRVHLTAFSVSLSLAYLFSFLSEGSTKVPLRACAGSALQLVSFIMTLMSVFRGSIRSTQPQLRVGGTKNIARCAPRHGRVASATRRPSAESVVIASRAPA